MSDSTSDEPMNDQQRQAVEQKLEHLLGDKDYSRGLEVGQENSESGLSNDAKAIIAAIQDLKAVVVASARPVMSTPSPVFVPGSRSQTSKTEGSHRDLHFSDPDEKLLAENLVKEFATGDIRECGFDCLMKNDGTWSVLSGLPNELITTACAAASYKLGMTIVKSHVEEDTDGFHDVVWFKRVD